MPYWRKALVLADDLHNLRAVLVKQLLPLPGIHRVLPVDIPEVLKELFILFRHPGNHLLILLHILIVHGRPVACSNDINNLVRLVYHVDDSIDTHTHGISAGELSLEGFANVGILFEFLKNNTNCLPVPFSDVSEFSFGLCGKFYGEHQ